MRVKIKRGQGPLHFSLPRYDNIGSKKRKRERRSLLMKIFDIWGGSTFTPQFEEYLKTASAADISLLRDIATGKVQIPPAVLKNLTEGKISPPAARELSKSPPIKKQETTNA